MFYDDALTASRELEITLTGKNCGQEEKAPMCGVPFHSCEPYINKLVEKGFRVAICEQVEDPKAAKGIVKQNKVFIFILYLEILFHHRSQFSHECSTSPDNKILSTLPAQQEQSYQLKKHLL